MDMDIGYWTCPDVSFIFAKILENFGVAPEVKSIHKKSKKTQKINI